MNIFQEIQKGFDEPHGLEYFNLVQVRIARTTDLDTWVQDQMNRVSHLFEEWRMFKTPEEIATMKTETESQFIQFHNLANGNQS